MNRKSGVVKVGGGSEEEEGEADRGEGGDGEAGGGRGGGGKVLSVEESWAATIDDDGGVRGGSLRGGGDAAAAAATAAAATFVGKDTVMDVVMPPFAELVELAEMVTGPRRRKEKRRERRNLYRYRAIVRSIYRHFIVRFIII